MKTVDIAKQAFDLIQGNIEDREDQIRALNILAKLIHPGLNITYDKEIANSYSFIRS